MEITFADKIVSYDTFVNDLASRMVDMLKASESDPEYISQRKAYKLFGRANVTRWQAQGKLHPSKRPGKVDYQMRELRRLQHTEQDYL